MKSSSVNPLPSFKRLWCFECHRMIGPYSWKGGRLQKPHARHCRFSRSLAQKLRRKKRAKVKKKI